jgi:hypothetical protein
VHPAHAAGSLGLLCERSPPFTKSNTWSTSRSQPRSALSRPPRFFSRLLEIRRSASQGPCLSACIGILAGMFPYLEYAL